MLTVVVYLKYSWVWCKKHIQVNQSNKLRFPHILTLTLRLLTNIQVECEANVNEFQWTDSWTAILILNVVMWTDEIYSTRYVGMLLVLTKSLYICSAIIQPEMSYHTPGQKSHLCLWMNWLVPLDSLSVWLQDVSKQQRQTKWGTLSTHPSIKFSRWTSLLGKNNK